MSMRRDGLHISLQEFVDVLGPRYSIRNIDWEDCLYRDFGNGFTTEVSGLSKPERIGPAIVYLWFGTDDNIERPFPVKMYKEVGRTIAEVEEAIVKAWEYSEELVKQGLNSAEKLKQAGISAKAA